MNWSDIISQQQKLGYYQDMQQQLQQQRQTGAVIYPAEADVFNAFSLTPFEQVKVVILGQDPYHGPGQAHGLAFSVLPDVKVPPSLKNIYKELVDDIDGFVVPEHGNLTAWAEQGVLLLNTVLTVCQGQAHSHAKLGWETFTDAIIEALNQYRDNIVFILWGKHAQQKGKHIDANKHFVLSGAHPSPLSAYRGFFGCRHFSTANQYLLDSKQQPIDWRLIKNTSQQQALFD
ncbi:uracil-DNA glycosylase [Thalassotalea maritima]|uniref:uracil-DNA glycosylase n=1 Tax=Thalassotalea maritima TaxID=3242416 RepID=UPI00352728C3